MHPSCVGWRATAVVRTCGTRKPFVPGRVFWSRPTILTPSRPAKGRASLGRSIDVPAPRPGSHPALNERLDILERTIGNLAREVRALREAVNRLEARREPAGRDDGAANDA